MKNVLSVVLICFLVGFYSCNGQKPSNKEITKILENSEIEIEKGNIKTASKLLDNIEKWDNKNGYVFELRSKIACFEGNYEKALKLAEKAMTIMPENAELYCLKGLIFFKSGVPDSALYYCLLCVDNVKSDDTYYSLALAYKINSEFDKSLKYLDSALSLKKDYITYSQKGEIFLMLNEYKKAIDECNMALALNKNDGGSYYIRGIAYLKLGDTIKCCEDFRTALPLIDKDRIIQDINKVLKENCK